MDRNGSNEDERGHTEETVQDHCHGRETGLRWRVPAGGMGCDQSGSPASDPSAEHAEPEKDDRQQEAERSQGQDGGVVDEDVQAPYQQPTGVERKVAQHKGGREVGRRQSNGLVRGCGLLDQATTRHPGGRHDQTEDRGPDPDEERDELGSQLSRT